MTTVDAAEARLAALETTANLAWWDMACEATDATSAAAEAASAAYEHALADPELAAIPVDDRRAEVLHLMTAGDRKRTRLNSSHVSESRMPSSA